MIGRRRRLAAALAAGVAAAGLLTGCGGSSSGFQGIYSLPLPGGPNLGSHPYTVKAVFGNVVDLVPHANVEVNDVAVGQVTGLSVPPGSWDATVTMTINGSVKLPANAIAELTATSLLGEEYVALTPPPGIAATGTLVDGDTIPLQRTTENATVEQVLGALSLLLNGGGLAQIHTITVQLNDALSGNEPQIRSVLSEITTLVSNLNAHRADITSALDGLNRLSATLRQRDSQIAYVLDNMTPGLATLSDERNQMVTMLNALNKLSGVAVATINSSAANTVADLKDLQPILRNLANAGKALPDALQVLFTYPFPDGVLGDIKGDYLNAFLNVTARNGTCVYAPLVPGAQSSSSAPGPLTCPAQP
ncbi:MAG TPA: MCE family protein [Trebonia sp.]|jgi:phospholipid/cholesterol/gamma-HCH transport system substrate-binding protein|nr:MCE family protein [Trebonia sp.]